MIIVLLILLFFPVVATGDGANCGSEIQQPLRLASITVQKDDDPIMAAQNFVCPDAYMECRTSLCKDANGRYLCCPSESPYLNHCNCLCYESPEAATADAQCPKYTACK